MKNDNPNTTIQSEQPQPVIPPKGKLYTPIQVFVATFIGTIVVGGFMMAHNFRLMGELRRAIVTCLVVLFPFVLLMSLGMIVKCGIRFNFFVSFVPALVTYYLTHKWQQEAIDNHIAQGGSTKGWLGVIVILASIYLVLLITTFWASFISALLFS